MCPLQELLLPSPGITHLDLVSPHSCPLALSPPCTEVMLSEQRELGIFVLSHVQDERKVLVPYSHPMGCGDFVIPVAETGMTEAPSSFLVAHSEYSHFILPAPNWI